MADAADMTLSRSWAVSGQAIDGVGDSHLASGMHYRILTNPMLGLPAAPLRVSRATLGPGAKGLTRSDVTWIDERGETRTPPFTITPDNAVTAQIPSGNVCCWVAVEGQPSKKNSGPILVPHKPPIFRVPGVVPAEPLKPLKPKPLKPLKPTHRERVRQDLVERTHPTPLVRGATGKEWSQVVEPVGPPIVRAPFPRGNSRLSVEGVVTTDSGDATVAVRSSAPFHIYASHIERVIVRGSGTVTGLKWLPAAAVESAAPFRVTTLPIEPAPRYFGPRGGNEDGLNRAERGAPRRYGMHESAIAANPSRCAAATASSERARVETLSSTAAESLAELMKNSPLPQSRQTVSERLENMGAPPVRAGDRRDPETPFGTSDRYLLMDVLMGAIDPGFARWLGFLDVDQTRFARGDVVAYVVEVIFAPDWERLCSARLDRHVQPSIIRPGTAAMERVAKSDPAVPYFLDKAASEGQGPFIMQRVVLAATVGYPLDSPSDPVLAPPESGAWLPSTPPSAIREMTVAIDKLVPGAGLASAIAQPDGARASERNLEGPRGRRLLMTPQRPQPLPESGANPGRSSMPPGSGSLADRRVAYGDGRWQIAQLDWFGRWSGWGKSAFGAGVRPGPPRPTVLLTTEPPVVSTPAPTGALAGTVRIEVPVPPPEGLAPGARLLKHLELAVTTSGSGSSTLTRSVAELLPPGVAVIVEVDGPRLMPTTSGTVTVTARWTDTAGVDSDDSEPKTVKLVDPRAPSPVSIDPTLTYTARPDATGRARTTLRWMPVPSQASYRVFFADETTLRAKLTDVARGSATEGDVAGGAPTARQAGGMLDALERAADDSVRAAVWEAHRGLIPRRWWLQLTGDPITAPTDGGQASFTHDVSGSLVVLGFYRIVAVSASSVESDFGTSPLLPRRVPNMLVPPVPSLRVRSLIDDVGNLYAELTVTVPLGPVPAARYRLRRSTGSSSADVMQIVGTGTVEARPDGEPESQEFIIFDTGSSPDGVEESLSAWIRYTWCVEVQGANAPGGGPPGDWSSPSAPVAADTLAPGPPSGVTDVSVTSRTGADRGEPGMEVSFQHPDTLAGGASQGYTIDVYRQLVGEVLRPFMSIAGQAPPPIGRGADVDGRYTIPDPDPRAVTGTMYRVIVTDPIGRSSPPSAPKEAP